MGKKGILGRKFLDPDSDLVTGSRSSPLRRIQGVLQEQHATPGEALQACVVRLEPTGGGSAAPRLRGSAYLLLAPNCCLVLSCDNTADKRRPGQRQQPALSAC